MVIGGIGPHRANLIQCQHGSGRQLRRSRDWCLTCGSEVLYTVPDYAWEASFLAIESHELLERNAEEVGSSHYRKVDLFLMLEVLSSRAI